MVTLTSRPDVASLTTFGIHAHAALLATYETADDLRFLLRDDTLPRPFKHIGAGSNLLFLSDFEGTLLAARSKGLISMEDDGSDTFLATYHAGTTLDNVIAEHCAEGIWGLENLSGIPGQVGSSIVQNVGAYGLEISDVVERAELFDRETGDVVTFPRRRMALEYRDSCFKHEPDRSRYIVLNVTYRLSRISNPRLGYANLHQSLFEEHGDLTPAKVRVAVLRMRESKLPDPAVMGSAGSFFKNPVVSDAQFQALETANPGIPGHRLPDGKVKLTAAWLIDRAGCKTMTDGGAAVWQKQPLVIVNATGKATGRDVERLEQKIISSVAQKYGVVLSPEVEHIGCTVR